MHESGTQPGKICVIGLGYVGTSLAVTLAARGRYVVGVERDPEICRMLRQKTPHVHEEGLQLEEAVDSGRLRVFNSIPRDAAIDTYVVCVGTNVDAEGGPDLTQVESVAREISEVANDGALVVLRSTVPVGTSRRLRDRCLTAGGKNLDIAFCPERTVQGLAVHELRSLPQIVGGDSSRARARAARLFHDLTDRIVEVEELETAEMAKLACNAFRYTVFAFANELALLCESVGVSMSETLRAASSGYERGAIPQPGPAGGSCLPKDAKMLAGAFGDFTSSVSPLLDSVSRVHGTVTSRVSEVIFAHGRELTTAGRTEIALLGVAFKGNPPTDDARMSPSVDLIEQLRERFPQARVRSHDPLVGGERQSDLGFEPCSSIEEAVSGAHIVVIGTNHKDYADLSLPDVVRYADTRCVVYDVWALHAQKSGQLPQGTTYLAFGEGQLLAAGQSEAHDVQDRWHTN
ncbi:nucleotide sugar dehydrogenase [Streptomyces bottropensis]|uniref:nucleotide sugar dehydrogenase n=1 Tax=Streptomyces bottropensis TaxID=42235 RepID=UPI00382CF304